MTYAEKLRDPRWQKKRLGIFERDNWKCVWCENAEKTLHVHHLHYLPGKDPWGYEDCELETLCCDCHEWASADESGVKILLQQSFERVKKMLEAQGFGYYFKNERVS